jgi:hypothetical protein
MVSRLACTASRSGLWHDIHAMTCCRAKTRSRTCNHALLCLHAVLAATLLLHKASLLTGADAGCTQCISYTYESCDCRASPKQGCYMLLGVRRLAVQVPMRTAPGHIQQPAQACTSFSPLAAARSRMPLSWPQMLRICSSHCSSSSLPAWKRSRPSTWSMVPYADTSASAAEVPPHAVSAHPQFTSLRMHPCRLRLPESCHLRHSYDDAGRCASRQAGSSGKPTLLRY